MVEVPMQAVIHLEWVDGLEADDEFDATRGGWFLSVEGSGLYIGPDPGYPADGHETPGQALDAAVKWAADRGMDILRDLDIEVTFRQEPLDGRR